MHTARCCFLSILLLLSCCGLMTLSNFLELSPHSENKFHKYNWPFKYKSKNFWLGTRPLRSFINKWISALISLVNISLFWRLLYESTTWSQNKDQFIILPEKLHSYLCHKAINYTSYRLYRRSKLLGMLGEHSRSL